MRIGQGLVRRVGQSDGCLVCWADDGRRVPLCCTVDCRTCVSRIAILSLSTLQVIAADLNCIRLYWLEPVQETTLLGEGVS